MQGSIASLFVLFERQWSLGAEVCEYRDILEEGRGQEGLWVAMLLGLAVLTCLSMRNFFLS